MVLDHFGTPIGVGRFADAHDEIFAAWKDDVAAIARCENVVAKLGGLAMPDNGFGWHRADRPPTSDEFVAAQGRYYRHTIECFGPDRCMFESNFPVDRMSLSYPVLWNAFKKIAADYSPSEQDALFAGHRDARLRPRRLRRTTCAARPGHDLSASCAGYHATDPPDEPRRRRCPHRRGTTTANGSTSTSRRAWRTTVGRRTWPRRSRPAP